MRCQVETNITLHVSKHALRAGMLLCSIHIHDVVNEFLRKAHAAIMGHSTDLAKVNSWLIHNLGVQPDPLAKCSNWS
jgi:hypothetical protein